MFPISPSFGVSGMLCFVIVVFPEYLHIFRYMISALPNFFQADCRYGLYDGTWTMRQLLAALVVPRLQYLIKFNRIERPIYVYLPLKYEVNF